MDGDQALCRLLVLDERPLGEVELLGDGSFELDLRSHPARFGLSSQVVAIKGMAVRHIQDLILALDIL